jgi:hypothetical protein
VFGGGGVWVCVGGWVRGGGACVRAFACARACAGVGGCVCVLILSVPCADRYPNSGFGGSNLAWLVRRTSG